MASTVIDAISADVTVIRNRETGIVAQGASLVSAEFTPVTLLGASDLLVAGSIIGADSAVLLRGSNPTVSITQSGSLNSGSGPAIATGDDVRHVVFRLVNAGSIATGNMAADVRAELALITNSGSIDGELTIVTIGGMNLINSGTILSQSFGIQNYGAGADYIENTGTIVGDIAVWTGPGEDTVVNTGTIVGRMIFEGDNDLYDGRGGVLRGEVAMGAGADRAFGGAGAEAFDGNAGADTLRGGGGEDSVLGGSGEDQVFGQGGDDTLFGGLGSDLVVGGRGDDSVHGDLGDDTVRGGKGDDTVQGSGGRDRLSGGKDDDLLIGGADADLLDGGPGADRLRGQTGADIFVFGPGNGRDVVLDMTDGADKVDLRGWDYANFAMLRTRVELVTLDDAVRLDFGSGDVLTLRGIEIGQFNGADVLF